MQEPPATSPGPPAASATHGPRPAVVAGLVPARWGSTRFPGKPLHPIAGRPLIEHVWNRCRHARQLDLLAVATDDPRIADAATAFGARVLMTRDDHASGTDRCAEAAAALADEGVTHVINIQGDEPLIDPALIDQLAALLRSDPAIAMVTAASRLTDPAEIASEHVVKVVLDDHGRALYFSRSPIPFFRRPAPDFPAGPPFESLRHIGIYGYRIDVLQRLVSLPPAPLEQVESLEQLRALSAGIAIHVVLTAHASPGIDTPAQAAALERHFQLAQGTDPASVPQPGPASGSHRSPSTFAP